MANLALKDDQPGKDNSWWVEPALVDNLFEACKTIPSATWRTIVMSTSKKRVCSSGYVKMAQNPTSHQ
jgi:hypothetical protein